MNWEKLNEVDTYKQIWMKVTGIFKKKPKKTTNDMDPNSTDTEMLKQPDTLDTENTEETTSHNNEEKVVDLVSIMHVLAKKKIHYLIAFPISLAIGILLVIDMPKFYTSETTMAPEIENDLPKNGSISSLAQSFGFDLSNVQSTDAISPILYPDLMTDNGFVVGLFNIPVTTIDGKINTTYYDYLRYHQKASWESRFSNWMVMKLGKLTKKKDDGNDSIAKGAPIDPYHLSKIDDSIVGIIKGSISVTTDKKTGVISVSVQSQDPMVCKIMADSVRERIQRFIITYRTGKAQRDVEYYQKLTDDARSTYEKTRRKYAEVADQNTDVILETVKSKIEDLENTMQLQYNAYTTVSSQLEAARAKLRQYTPVFTVIEGAAVPVLHSGPKRMLMVIGFVFGVFVVMTLYFLRNILFKK